MALRDTPRDAAESAINSIGLGYDVSSDIRLKFCKRECSQLIDLGHGEVREVLLPGGVSVSNVPNSIKVDKGERTRFTSDLLSFLEMTEQFNQGLSIPGKIPSGLFNHMFEFSGCWQKDASNTKALAYDGWFISLYTIALPKSKIVLCDHVKEAVPSSWDPAALAKFIDRFGTHVIVGITMGGKDVIYLRQQHSSSLQAAELQNKLKETADKKFLYADEHSVESVGNQKFSNREQRLMFMNTGPSGSYSTNEDIMTFFKRRGGRNGKTLSHAEWLPTIQSQPDVISMSFVPIAPLLTGIPGSGFLTHAINLYLRYKPQIQELHQFLEFQLPRQWAPVFSELPLGPPQKSHKSVSLPFNLIGPKLYVNTSLVDVGRRPVTGLRLYLEGKSGNRLAIHLQHLSSAPSILKLEEERSNSARFEECNDRYYEPIRWKHFSHVYTAPIESDDDLSIVTGAQLEVAYVGFKKVLSLKLIFSRVLDMKFISSQWEGSPRLTQKSGIISTLISTHFSTPIQRPPPRPEEVNTNSAVYPKGPPVPVQAPKLLKLIDTAEMTRGPQHLPGHWMVSGAKLHVERGKISLRVKFSHLTALLPDYEELV